MSTPLWHVMSGYTWRKVTTPVLVALVFIIMMTMLSPPNYSSVFTNIRGKKESKNKPGIPNKITQIFSVPADFEGPGPFTLDPNSLSDAAFWLAKNPGFKYTLLGAKAADDFVNHHFSESHSILHAYHTLKDPGMKTDLLRYLIMLAEGGVYSDLDTQALKPINDWIPQHLRGSVRAVVGIEWDQLDGDPWLWPGPGPGGEPSSTRHIVQFCQWTLAATPGHPLFSTMVDETVRGVRRLAAAKELTFSQLRPTVYEVMTTTGPAAWTDVVFRHLQKADASLTSLRQLSNMTQPRLFGDVLVLPIDGFGMGQEHSHSTNDGSIPESALIRHNFRHTWWPQDA